MYKNKVRYILLINSYLIKYKITDPTSDLTKSTQRYLTQQINDTLDRKENRFSLIYFALFLIFK